MSSVELPRDLHTFYRLDALFMSGLYILRKSRGMNGDVINQVLYLRGTSGVSFNFMPNREVEFPEGVNPLPPPP